MRSSRGASRPSAYGRAASGRAARSPTTSPRAAAPAIAASSFTLCLPTEVFRGEGKMGLLIAKILFLLVLAAACGALFAYWWFRRHYEDVTLEYSRSREEWSAWRRGFEERLAARPEVDLRPLTEELTALSEQLTAFDDSMRPNLAAVEKRLTAIEHALLTCAAIAGEDARRHAVGKPGRVADGVEALPLCEAARVSGLEVRAVIGGQLKHREVAALGVMSVQGAVFGPVHQDDGETA